MAGITAKQIAKLLRTALLDALNIPLNLSHRVSKCIPNISTNNLTYNLYLLAWNTQYKMKHVIRNIDEIRH